MIFSLTINYTAVQVDNNVKSLSPTKFQIFIILFFLFSFQGILFLLNFDHVLHWENSLDAFNAKKTDPATENAPNE